MAYDAKYGTVKVEHEPGNPFGEDEPVFILRARDATSPAVLVDYRTRVTRVGSPLEHVHAVDKVIEAFERWQQEHPDLVKVPD